MQTMVIHQFHLNSIIMNEPGFKEGTGEAWQMAQDFMSKYGTNFRTFQHGMVHGLIAGFFIALPIHCSLCSLLDFNDSNYVWNYLPVGIIFYV